MVERRYEDARAQRDAMIGMIEVDIEMNYQEFVSRLSESRAAINTAADMTQLGLSAAIGVASGVDVKDILSATLTAFQGSRLSFDKNFFREKATEVLVSQMEASRESIRNRITSTVASMDAKQYMFEEAWRDLVEFFYAGTLESALIQLNNQAGSNAASEKAQAKSIDIRRAATAADADAAVRIRSNYARLYADALGKDVAKSDAAIKTAKDILIALGGGDKTSTLTDPADIMKALQEQIKKALQDPTLIPQLDRLLTQTDH